MKIFSKFCFVFLLTATSVFAQNAPKISEQDLALFLACPEGTKEIQGNAALVKSLKETGKADLSKVEVPKEDADKYVVGFSCHSRENVSTYAAVLQSIYLKPKFNSETGLTEWRISELTEGESSRGILRKIYAEYFSANSAKDQKEMPLPEKVQSIEANIGENQNIDFIQLTLETNDFLEGVRENINATFSFDAGQERFRWSHVLRRKLNKWGGVSPGTGFSIYKTSYPNGFETTARNELLGGSNFPGVECGDRITGNKVTLASNPQDYEGWRFSLVRNDDKVISTVFVPHSFLKAHPADSDEKKKKLHESSFVDLLFESEFSQETAQTAEGKAILLCGQLNHVSAVSKAEEQRSVIREEILKILREK